MAWVRLSGWSSNGLSFSFRAPRCLRLSAADLRRLAPARACGRSRSALPGDSGKADSKSAERQRMENAGQIGPAPSDARWQSAAGGGPKVSANPGPRDNPAKRFSWGEDEHRNERAFGVSRKRGIWRLRGRGPAPNADTDSTSQGLLLGPPYHKQIRHKVPFCAQAFSFPPLRRRLKVNCPAGAREAPLEGFFDAVKEKWGPHPPSPRGGTLSDELLLVDHQLEL